MTRRSASTRAGRHSSGAWINQEEPPVLEEPAFIYALQGGWPASNVDPYADRPTADNEWLGIPDPHIAVLVTDASMLEGISTDPNNGGPWIMWRDTPYAQPDDSGGAETVDGGVVKGPEAGSSRARVGCFR